jgi:predicted DNA-binding transcriptional regulator YafY
VSRTERLLELMTLVKAKGGRFTVQEMSEQFSVSRRTMLRDLQALSTMGVPLAASPGPGGGYSLAYPGRSVALSLEADEALGLILSYEGVLQDAPSPFREPSISAITKLRTALAPDVVRALDRLRQRVAVVGVPRTYEAPFLADLLQAAMDQVHLRISYESRNSHSERIIYPYGLIAALGFWYCACYDYKRRAHAWLRADRIGALKRVQGRDARQPMTLDEWLAQSSQVSEETVRLKATVSARGMKNLDWSVFREGLAQNANGSGTIDVDVPVSSLDFYARVLLPLGGQATVKSPPQLVKLLTATAREISSLYGKAKPR